MVSLGSKPALRRAILAGTVVVPVVITVALKPISQPAWYHNFADARALLGVPNALNVLSNFSFIAVGLAGFHVTLRNGSQSALQRWACAILFAGLFLTGLGSGYYHLAPGNERLLWDRLPMTVAMAGILTLLVVDRFQAARWWTLPALLVVGPGSALQWAWSEAHGHGDLRWYALYEALVIITGTTLLLLFPARVEGTRALAIALGANIAAKIFELLDKPIYALGQLVSGHTLKHLSAGLGFIPLVLWLASQRPESEKARGQSAAR